MSYSEFFYELTGHWPYDFQEALACRLLRGESLVFRAPTGSGKTWATVAPFLYSLQRGARLADRLIYALPLRSLASSLHSTVYQSLSRFRAVAISAKDRQYPGESIFCSLQMGGEKNDPFFEGDLIFCTIDQVLSGYLMMPLSLPDRLANMVAGALPGPLVILDEAHLMESRIALGTVIEMLDRFRDTIQFVLMTATMSDESMKWLARKLGASVPDLPEQEMRQLPVQRTKRRIWQWRIEPLDFRAVTNAHQMGRTLVIVNQVERAQLLYSRLKNVYETSPTRIACLHSRFLPEDRKRAERSLEPWFGPDPSETDVILVTTQVVEAGMDISADHILTDLAPMNSLVQRAGRTARYVARCQGIVTVFEVENSLPYDDAEEEFTKTRECLRELNEDGENVDFSREQVWVEAVHADIEKADLTNYENLCPRRNRVEDAIRSGERGLLSDLVRDIDTFDVLLSSAPGTVEFSDRRWPSLLSLPRTSVWKLREAIQRGTRDIWMAKDPGEESGPTVFEWQPVEDTAQLKGAWLVALGSAAASYTPETGLRLGEAGKEIPVQYAGRPPFPRYQYRYESWVDHVSRVLVQARAMAAANATGAIRLDGQLAMEPGTTETLVELAVALHDVGKLSTKWQASAWEYETARTGRKRTEAIAHTTKCFGERGRPLQRMLWKARSRPSLCLIGSTRRPHQR